MSAGRPCSTCGRAPDAVKKLFPARSPSSALVICDHCVSEASEMIENVPTRIPGAAHTCSFCGKTEEHVAVIIGIGQTMICDECVDAYRAEL